MQDCICELVLSLMFTFVENFTGFLFNDFILESVVVVTKALFKINVNSFQENGVSSQSLIIRRMKTVEQETSG